MTHELNFARLIERMRAWREELEPQLHEPHRESAHADALQLKRQIEAGLLCLEFCEQHGLHPLRLQKALVLPPPRSFGGEYRVVDDEDSGDPNDWVNPTIHGKQEALYVGIGAVIV